MSSQLGNHCKISIFGQSHSKAIGVNIDGLPAGEAIDWDEILAFMARRAPGQGPHSTPRKEADLPIVLSGLVEGYTCGAPLCAIIENNDTRSKDYEALRDLPRPSHADYTAFIKYGKYHDIRGGGHFSGRLTAPLCFAGAIAKQLLARRGVSVGAHIAAIGSVADAPFDPVNLTPDQLLGPGGKSFPTIQESAGNAMLAQIEEARLAQDSLGGLVECAALGLPPGLGEPMFDGVENRLAAALFGIPALRGVEFGTGFAAATMRGSQHNDPFIPGPYGSLRTTSNHHGGVLGGITTGMPLVVRCAFKPTPSISQPQGSVSLTSGQAKNLVIEGRHDPCIVPRAVPVVEAVTALVLLDLLL